MSNKNLYDNFQKNGRNLRTQPSDRAWRKLESRLDGRQGVAKTLQARNWIMAASVLLLVGALAFITMTTEIGNSSKMAQNDFQTQFVVEDLSYTDVDINDMPSVQLQKRVANNNWTSINEGNSSSRLVVVNINKSPSKLTNPTTDIKVESVKSNQNRTSYTVTTTTQTESVERIPLEEGVQASRVLSEPESAATKSIQVYSNDFDWLEGDWLIGTKKETADMESWAYENANAMSNAKTKTTSKSMPLIMGLQCAEQDCILKMVVDENGEIQHFSSIDKSSDVFTFISKGEDFPQYVEILKEEDKRYSMELSGGKWTATQKAFLIEKGFVFLENSKAVRVSIRKEN